MPKSTPFTIYTFRGRSGYIVPADAAHALVSVGHTASVAPWSDPEVHLHGDSEEYYFLLQGQLEILVADVLLSLRPREILMVQPGVPHAIVGGTGRIEHFGLRAPALQDKRATGAIPARLPSPTAEDARELRCEWGNRIPLDRPENRNCWLIGVGAARFRSQHLILAFLDFPTAAAASAGIGTRHRPHLHEASWEYYVVLDGARTLQIEDEVLTIEAGEILEVPPGVCHTLHGRQPACRGFTCRVPVLAYNDKVECPAAGSRPARS